MPSEADFEDRYCEKFWSAATGLRQRPAEALELQSLEVPFTAAMKAAPIGPESWFWT
jgi:hypothetical protein